MQKVLSIYIKAVYTTQTPMTKEWGYQNITNSQNTMLLHQLLNKQFEVKQKILFIMICPLITFSVCPPFNVSIRNYIQTCSNTTNFFSKWPR